MSLLDLSISRGRVRSAWLFSSLAVSAAAACESPRRNVARDSAAGALADTVEPQAPRFATDAKLSISTAGSIAAVMRTLSDSFATREAVQVQRDTAATVEAAASSGLERRRDIVVLEDTAFSHLPPAAQVKWYIRFAADSLANAGVRTAVTTGGATSSPIIHGLSIPRDAPNPLYAERFVRFVLSDDGKRILRAAHLDPLDPPRIVGTGAPPAIVALITAAGGSTVEPHDTVTKAR